jgi:archaellum component FlaD/FlaE
VGTGPASEREQPQDQPEDQGDEEQPQDQPQGSISDAARKAAERVKAQQAQEEEGVSVDQSLEDPTTAKLETLPDDELRSLLKSKGVPVASGWKRETLIRKAKESGIQP